MARRKCYHTLFQCDSSPRNTRIADRASEEDIDILIAGRKRFGLKYPQIAERSGFSVKELNSIFNKRKYATKREYRLIDRAMVDIVLENLGITRQQFMERTRKHRTGHEH